MVWWFSPGAPASSTTKTGRHDIAEILLKVALNTINQFKSKPNLLGCRGQPRNRSVSTLVIYISDHKTLYFTVVIMYYN
jgi:hypothetical protein